MNDIVIESDIVSRNHFEISYDEPANQYFITDLGSTNGTSINLYQFCVEKDKLIFLNFHVFEYFIELRQNPTTKEYIFIASELENDVKMKAVVKFVLVPGHKYYIVSDQS